MKALAKISALDLDQLMNELSDTIAQLSRIAGSPELRASLKALPPAIEHLGDAAAAFQRLADHTNVELSTTTEALRKTSATAVATLQEAQKNLNNLAGTIGPGSSLDYQLGQTLQDLDQAARSTRELTDYLDRNPSALLRGRGSDAH
jgi:paraquat-inducible protein B